MLISKTKSSFSIKLEKITLMFSLWYHERFFTDSGIEVDGKKYKKLLVLLKDLEKGIAKLYKTEEEENLLEVMENIIDEKNIEIFKDCLINKKEGNNE